MVNQKNTAAMKFFVASCHVRPSLAVTAPLCIMDMCALTTSASEPGSSAVPGKSTDFQSWLILVHHCSKCLYHPSQSVPWHCIDSYLAPQHGLSHPSHRCRILSISATALHSYLCRPGPLSSVVCSTRLAWDALRTLLLQGQGSLHSPAMKHYRVVLFFKHHIARCNFAAPPRLGSQSRMNS